MSALPRIDQMMAGFSVGDATSHAALLMRDTLRERGHASDIFVSDAFVMPAIRHECRPLSDHPGGRGDVVLHHFGNWSDATDAFIRTTGRKTLIYHNITPGHYFQGIDDAAAEQLDRARDRIPEVLAACDALWAVSDYNARELRALTDTPVDVFPLPFSHAPLDTAPRVSLLKRLDAPVITWLAVGRMAPNKRLEELIRAFAFYHRACNPFSRLLLVGSDRSAPRYVTYLKLLAHEWGVPNVCFEGFVWPDALAAYYERADLYVSASDHEGYGLPLLEAMYKKIPVMAKRAGGTSEAMGGAGLSYEALSPAELAAAAHEVIGAPSLKNALLSAQQERVQRELDRDIGAELADLLSPLLEGSGSPH